MFTGVRFWCVKSGLHGCALSKYEQASRAHEHVKWIRLTSLQHATGVQAYGNLHPCHTHQVKASHKPDSHTAGEGIAQTRHTQQVKASHKPDSHSWWRHHTNRTHTAGEGITRSWHSVTLKSPNRIELWIIVIMTGSQTLNDKTSLNIMLFFTQHTIFTLICSKATASGLTSQLPVSKIAHPVH